MHFFSNGHLRKSDAVIESIQGFQMTRDQKDRMIMIKDHLDFVENSISELDQKLDQMIAPYEHLITLLSTIPGVKRSSAITIISEISTDMTQFSSSKHLCSWAGLTPETTNLPVKRNLSEFHVRVST